MLCKRFEIPQEEIDAKAKELWWDKFKSQAKTLLIQNRWKEDK